MGIRAALKVRSNPLEMKHYAKYKSLVNRKFLYFRVPQ